MKIIIRIENCETISDFYSHLTELRLQIKKEAKKLKLNPLRDAFPKLSGEHLKDFNCYGEHYVSINMEDNSEPSDDYFNSDESKFIQCSLCDGHPACEDFGCAFNLGLGQLVKNNI